ncbi:TetR family transcriptional regulator [Patulibacter sp. NPDC049589]|uniref:TetR/AcrR family transcriptional regulator n=1 Tax=Patulibacter sp. NPDC049589 TaxID=3154731 RepID=UPI00341B75D6
MTAPAAKERRRPTQEERRAATRASIVAAAVEALAQDGYVALTTRSVAQRAGVSQASVMHYFATRGLLLTAAMTTLCRLIVDEVEARAADLPSDDGSGAAILDHLWDQLRGPRGTAIGQVWCAAWSDDDLTPVVAEFDREHIQATLSAMQRAYPPDTDPERLSAYVELVLATMKGLLLVGPVTTPEGLCARWATVRPMLIRAGADLRDG